MVLLMSKIDDDDKQLIFSLGLMNKETGKGISDDILCPKGMQNPKELTKHLSKEIERALKKLLTPQTIESLLIRN